MKEKNNNNKRKKLVWGVPFKVYVVQAAGDALAAWTAPAGSTTGGSWRHRSPLLYKWSQTIRPLSTGGNCGTQQDRNNYKL